MSDYQAALKEYVEQAKASGMTYDEVRQGLIDGGWDAGMVDQMLPEAFGEPAGEALPATGPEEKPATPPAYTPPMASSAPPAYTPPMTPPGVPPAYPTATPPTYPGAAGYAVAPGGGLGDWFSRGWAMVTSDVGTFVLATLVAALLSVTVICAPPMMVGMYRLCLKKHDGQPIAVGDLFEGFQFFAKAWGAFLIVMVASVVVSGTVAALFGHGGKPDTAQQMVIQGVSSVWGLIIGTFTLFLWPLIADGREGALGALSLSISTVLTNFLVFLVFVFLCQLVASAGIIACCVGVLFTGPLANCAMVACYRSYFPARA